MSINIRIAIFIMGMILFLGIFELVRKRKFREELSIIWLIVGVGLILTPFADFIIDPLSIMLGIHYPLALVIVIIAILFVFVMLYFSLVVSDLRTQNKELIQKMALMEYELENMSINSESHRDEEGVSG
ncbi:MAG: hypothetical protein AMK70_13300 [Nitrospira bacterium SG8_35_1]|nr:MAG: hypothetical protein AMK70_13300 [Nitrospira bacterium SG8_35_1]